VLTLTIERARPAPAEQAHDTFESQGSLVESTPQSRYIGFTPQEAN